MKKKIGENYNNIIAKIEKKYNFTHSISKINNLLLKIFNKIVEQIK